METKFGLVEALLSVLCVICTAGIPWAYSVHGRMIGIESALNHQIIELKELDARLTSSGPSAWQREQMRLWVERTKINNPDWKPAEIDSVPPF